MRRFNKKTLLIISSVILVLFAVGGFWIWKANQPRSLLPPSITKQAVSFLPYFYFGQIPAGYELDEAQMSFNGDVLLMPLTKPGNPTIVITQQPLPTDLPEDFQNGNPVTGTVGSATIQEMSGRLVGILVAPGPPKTLVLLSTSGTITTGQLKALLQGLQPAR